jgi:hypothetical protein
MERRGAKQENQYPQTTKPLPELDLTGDEPEEASFIL